ncbi:MAG: hypothetical protein JWR60_4269 [Polaromonas sp.]|nr:hypothetical protein [Polaromonas sp.]
MKRKIYLGLVLVTLAWLAGCAGTPQAHVAFNAEKTAGKSERIGVAMTKMPKVDTVFPGASCLLCLATASLMNSSLTAHTKTLPVEDLSKLKVLISEALVKKGANAVVVPDDIGLDSLPSASVKGANLALKDFSSLKEKYKIDKLLLIDIRAIGVERNYSAYIPVGNPQGMLRGIGYLVNLSTNTYEWYLPVDRLQSPEGAWDEPPKFPGVTNAYFQALELSRDSFLEPFVK